MSDRSYWNVRRVCYPVFWVSSRPVVLHADRSGHPGPYILVSTHTSPFDVPLLIAHNHRPIDWVSVVEFLKNPFWRWLFRQMNTFYIDRDRTNSAAVRVALQRLEKGRIVGIFPEGNIRPADRSMLNGGPIKPGAIRLAAMSGAPLLPAVVVGSTDYLKARNWFPFAGVRYGVNYGEPIFIPRDDDSPESLAAHTERLRQALRALAAELAAAMGEGEESPPLVTLRASAPGGSRGSENPVG